MANPSQKQIFPSGKDGGPAPKAPDLHDFVDLLPGLYYGTNKLLQESTAALSSRKIGIALWALAGSTKKDDVGLYLTVGDLVTTFRDWLVVNHKGASSVVSKVKKAMLKADYIMIAGGSDHIHLTERGRAAARGMFEKANEVIRQAISSLQPEEQRSLLDYANRMIGASRKRPSGSTPL
jgi:hypothetical protein